MKNERQQIGGFHSESANVNGVSLHYWIGGNPIGRPVLLWHGFLGTGYSWHKVMPLLADAGYSILVPDMRGYGDSDKPEGNDGYDGAALAEEFRALADQIGFRASGNPLTLVAHDMGAPLALLWAANHPDEIAALLYIEAPVMLQSVLERIICFTPAAMAKGNMWWWILPLALGVSRGTHRQQRKRVSQLVLPRSGGSETRSDLARNGRRIPAHLLRYRRRPRSARRLPHCFRHHGADSTADARQSETARHCDRWREGIG
jgi:pimeloyl-ACP methyl ester carboxylesterase